MTSLLKVVDGAKLFFLFICFMGMGGQSTSDRNEQGKMELNSSLPISLDARIFKESVTSESSDFLRSQFTVHHDAVPTSTSTTSLTSLGLETASETSDSPNVVKLSDRDDPTRSPVSDFSLGSSNNISKLNSANSKSNGNNAAKKIVFTPKKQFLDSSLSVQRQQRRIKTLNISSFRHIPLSTVSTSLGSSCKNKSELLVCEDLEGFSFLIFNLSSELASSDFQLHGASLIQTLPQSELVKSKCSSSDFGTEILFLFPIPNASPLKTTRTDGYGAPPHFAQVDELAAKVKKTRTLIKPEQQSDLRSDRAFFDPLTDYETRNIAFNDSNYGISQDHPWFFDKFWNEWSGFVNLGKTTFDPRSLDAQRFTQQIRRWLNEAAIDYGISNLNKLVISFLVYQKSCDNEADKKSPNKGRLPEKSQFESVVLQLNYTIDDTCVEPNRRPSHRANPFPLSLSLPGFNNRYFKELMPFISRFPDIGSPLNGLGTGSSGSRLSILEGSVCKLRKRCSEECSLDCDFGLEKECLWNWDADNFTGSTRGSTVYPGQNGFYRTNGEEVARLYSESSKNFFGPNKDSNNSTKGPFLYLLGRPLSDVANFTDKRIISQLIRESGNNCSVEIKLFYQNVKGAIIEFGTQNFAKAYSPIKEIIFTPANHTSHEGWKTFSIQYGRYVDPFSVSIDFKRSKFSETGSFIAIDDIKLVNCEPESSVPIDCSSKPSRNYGCPGGLGSPCLDGPSMLCDLKPDCPNGDDEKEDACYLMPREARCDFNNDDDFCGWRDPNGHLHRIAQWQRKKGQTKLEGIRGDLSHKNQGHYLYVSYEPGQDGTPGHGATLRSPAFPPPPKYNNNATSPYFKSCRIRLSYHMLSNSNTRRPGPLDLVVNFVNESSGSKSVMRPIHLTLDVPMGKNREGWIRWEAALPHQTQLRYYLSLIGSNGFGAKAELAVDDLSLSPQCFGQGVSPEHVGAWRYNMTDLEFCMYYGRSDCLSSKKSYGYKFSTCNAYGPLGPFPELCNEDYAGTSTSVMIGDVTKKGQESHQLGYVTGIQRWTVPATGIYTIIASGASGARGRQNNIQSYGDEIRALINLEANETIFILVGQMGISVCNNNGLLDDNSDCKGNDRQRRSPDPADYFYDLLQGEVQEQSETEDDEEEDDDNMYGKIIFAPFSSESNRGRQRRSVPAFMPRSSDNRRTPGKQARPDSMSELVRMMALSDGSTVPSTRMAANEDGSLDEEIIEQDKLHKQPQTSDEDHGRVHVSSDTMVQSQEKATYFNNVDQGPKQGGGGGGGATFIFRFIGNGTVQPLLIAAGGGGASDQQSTSLPGLHDAKGLVDPRATLAMLMKMVSQDDSDAGSGGGWNSNLSQACNFSIIHMNYQEKNKAQSTGFSMADSWMGGFPCSPNSEQWGGFGGGGAGCLGGGGGGGYIGGKGGTDQFTNGEGGWSYYNPDAILLVLDARTEAATSVVHMTNTGGQGNGAALEKLWKHQGQGRVFVIPSMPHDRSCQSNCSAFGAACVTLDPEMKKTQCVCPNGRLLDHINPKCNDELPLFVMAVIGVACVVTMAILGLLCMFLYTQYQRKHMQMLRRKMMSGPVVEGQLNRLRAMNVNVNINGVTMTEYNPNYEFGGGTCTLQDLREIPRENLRLVKALGQGAFGEVYQGFYKKSSSDTLEMSVAVKTLPELSSNQAEMDFLMEALIMSKFKHPNIVHFIGVCFEKHPRFIVLELLAGGDLKTFLRDSRPKPDRASPLVMRDLLLCAMDVAKGCEYLENNHFIHRDIAARNCLLTSKGPGRVAKIADFGMARDIYRGDYYRKGGKAMLPVKWMPPEAFLDGIFTSKTDVWSFGILLWEVMSLGYMPYPGRGNQEVMQLVTNGGRLEPPNYCPGPVYGLMCQCWHPIPEERPNFRTILERLGYCIQDPEVVMAPLPVCHRPMTSLENSRETSLSSGRGGGATTGSSADSGSGFSLPMRGAGAKGRPGQPNARSANVTPDSPGTTVTLAGASSSDYLVPLTGMPTRPAGLVTTDAQKRKSSRESIPASSPSDVPASDDEDSEMLLRRPSLPLTGEAETSFSCPPPSASARRAGGYTSLPQTESVTSKNRPNRRRRPSGSSSNKKLHQKSLSKNSINQIPPGSSSSSTSSCEPTSTRHPRSRLPSTSHPLEAAIEPPKRTTSVIASLQQDGVVNGLPLPPPPPRGYSDSSPSTKDDLSPVLPPLPPLPDEVRTPADKLPLDVSSLRAQHRHMVPYMNMDSNPGSPPRPSVITNPTPYVIHAPSSTNSSTTSTRPKATEPPSEISV